MAGHLDGIRSGGRSNAHRAHPNPSPVEEFRQDTIENARASVQEASIARFDVAQQQDDARRFVLMEVCRRAKAPAAHRLRFP